MSRFKQLVAQLTSLVLVVTMIVPATLQIQSANAQTVYTDAYMALKGAGATGATTETAFMANNPATRGEVAQFIVISLGKAAEAMAITDMIWPDNTGSFKQHLAYLGAMGVISGFADGTVRASLSVNRSQFAKFVLNATGLATSANNRFSDQGGDPLDP